MHIQHPTFPYYLLPPNPPNIVVLTRMPRIVQPGGLLRQMPGRPSQSQQSGSQSRGDVWQMWWPEQTEKAISHGFC